MPSVPAVEVQRLSHAYGASTALDGVEFTVGAGEIFGLLGPNGGGKSTLFRILSTLLIPTAGQARVFGENVVAGADAVRRQIGVVFQSPSLDNRLSVEENLFHQGRLYGISGRDLTRRVEEMLARVSLADRARERVNRLSGGQRRRVEIAKGLLHQPRLLLLDEPSTGLDAGARRDLRLYLQQLRQSSGVTIFLTTHLMDEADACDRLGILDRGRLVALGTPDSLKQRIGGDVIVLETPAPESLRDQIQERFGGSPSVLDGMVRLERQEGHKFIMGLVEAYSGQIDGITVAKPTLEDVFIHETGHRFWDGRQP
jgi:ABC-2 type transport system ATP-binding protein